MSRPQQGINMIVRFKRKIPTEMMTTFEAALSVNLTTMLVTTAIFISKMGGWRAQDDRHLFDPLPAGSLPIAPRCSSHRYGVLQAGGGQPTD